MVREPAGATTTSPNRSPGPGPAPRARDASSTPPPATTSASGPSPNSTNSSSPASSGRSATSAKASYEPSRGTRTAHLREARQHPQLREAPRTAPLPTPAQPAGQPGLHPGPGRLEARALRRRTRHRQPDLPRLGRARTPLGRRNGRLPERGQARAARATTPSRFSRTPTATARCDKVTVFADGLNIPTSLTFANGGVIVHHAPETLFLKDTDGDDKADVREVLLSGWGTGDTHAGPSNLRYGLDNQTLGHGRLRRLQRHGRRQAAPLRHRASTASPKTAVSIEFLHQFNNNTWGLGFNAAGDVFGSTANDNPSFFCGIPATALPGRQAARAPG